MREKDLSHFWHVNGPEGRPACDLSCRFEASCGDACILTALRRGQHGDGSEKDRGEQVEVESEGGRWRDGNAEVDIRGTHTSVR